MKRITIYAIVVFLICNVPTVAYAADPTSVCEPIYGGGQTCTPSTQLSIDKKVKNPTTGDYVDTLGGSDPAFSPEEAVPFKITVLNTSKNDLSHITVTDFFPPFITYLSGNGTLDTNAKTLTFTIDKLAAGNEKVFYLEGKIATEGDLPANQTTICLVNQATATAGSINSQDNSRFCIKKTATTTSDQAAAATPTSAAPIPTKQTPSKQTANKTTSSKTTKGGLPVYQPTQSKKTPATGPEDWAVIGMIPTGALGYWLRRKTK